MLIELGLFYLAYRGAKAVAPEGQFDGIEGRVRELLSRDYTQRPAVPVEAESPVGSDGVAGSTTTGGSEAPGAPTAADGSVKIDAGLTERAPDPVALAREKNQMLLTNVSLISLATMVLRSVAPLAGYVGFGTYIYGMAHHLRDVKDELKNEGKLTAGGLFVLADGLALVTGSYVAVALSLFLQQSGKLGVMRSKDDSELVLDHLFRELPKTVWRVEGTLEREVPLDAVQRGDEIVLHSGAIVPVDGVIVAGIAGIDQQALTGESAIAEKGRGERVFANTRVCHGRVQVRAEFSGEDTVSHQIAQLLRSSANHKSTIQLKGERWADQLTTPMAISSLALLPLIGPVPTSVFINAHIGVRIRILAPMATLRCIAMASRQGVLVKDGRALETLVKVDTVLFDKTGTLTEDAPEVCRIVAVQGQDETAVLRYAAIAEQRLVHPIAQGILKKARESGLTLPRPEDSDYAIGYGIEVDCRGERIHVGSTRYFEEVGLPIPEALFDELATAAKAGQSGVLVAVAGQAIGLILMQARVRNEVREVVRQLRARGLCHLAIVSGDQAAATRQLAEALELDAWHAGVLPEEKAEIVERLQAEGKTVCFVGDGINDSIALRRADVAISIAGATDLAQDLAEIVLVDGSLRALDPLFEIARGLDGRLRQSLGLSLAAGGVNLLGAFVLHYGTLTSLLVNTGFGIYGASKVMQDGLPPSGSTPKPPGPTSSAEASRPLVTPAEQSAIS
ncbi:MAG TPA: heavy metal translocating P-type ATPase [Dehalococcoidia bacterium]|nr:heavy metal translocating P-type ATPase [Dehalococcoidia bacterium]